MIDPITIGNATLYLGDCLEILPTLGKVDCVICDPPYGINNDCDYTRFTNSIGQPNNFEQIKDDDKDFDPSPYLDFNEVILWGANNYCKHLEAGTWLVWNKTRPLNYGTFLSDAELAWCKGGNGIYMFDYEWKGFMRQGERGKTLHPTQKPIELMEWCIKKTKSDLICDPFMGSGTTGVAALKLDRKFIGIEIDEKYFKIACDRIETEYNQLKMF